MNIQKNVSLKQFNTFAIDVKTRYFTAIQHVETLQTLLSAHPRLSKLILGGGSNMLFTQDIDGLVIHNQIKGIEKINENHDHVWLKIGAGENWHKLVLYCLSKNYAGIENLSLIPGTVGAAPIQNIGAYGVELKETVFEVHAIDLENNTHRIFKNHECEFGYRDSIFKNRLKNQYMITHVILQLNKKPIFRMKYDTISEKLNGRTLSIQTISDIIIQIRQEKLPDPSNIPNAGSFFKNPIVSFEKLAALQEQYPTIPHFPEKNQIKIPAAWLIEQCGFKGKRYGQIGVHDKQALVLVNHGNATGLEIKKLAENIQNAVHARFDISLTTEVNIV